MKTFKHKKTGELITYKDGCIYANRTVIEAELNLQFWEEVVEKDYEILSFRVISNKVILNKLPNGLFSATYRDGHREEDILSGDPKRVGWDDVEEEGYCSLNEPYGYQIYSIKRLSDGEVFTLGDMCVADIKAFPITEFNIFDGVLLVSGYFEGSKSGFYNCKIKDLKKRKPLFKTFDGVEVFDGDNTYVVGTSNGIFAEEKTRIEEKLIEVGKGQLHEPSCIQGGKVYWLVFSTRELAEEFIVLNKPCLSLQEAMNNNNASLRELVKSRL